MRHHQFIATAGMLVVLGTGAMARQGTAIRVQEPQPDREIERSAVTFAGSFRSGLTNATRVVGSVIDIRQVPVALAKVQLRNIANGAVEQTAQTDDSGSYLFDLEMPGTYVVEMVLVDGAVVALSNAGAVARYETLQTVVQLPGRWDAAARNLIAVQSVRGFFGVSAETTMTAATIGIAVDASIPPANPGVPVSP